jgi:hypothetical protein
MIMVTYCAIKFLVGHLIHELSLGTEKNMSLQR